MSSAVCVVCSSVLLMFVLYQRYWSTPEEAVESSTSTVVVSLHTARVAPRMKDSVQDPDSE